MIMKEREIRQLIRRRWARRIWIRRPCFPGAHLGSCREGPSRRKDGKMRTLEKTTNEILFVGVIVTKWPRSATRSIQSRCAINFGEQLGAGSALIWALVQFSSDSEATKRQRMQRLMFRRSDCMSHGRACWLLVTTALEHGTSAFRTTYGHTNVALHCIAWICLCILHAPQYPTTAKVGFHLDGDFNPSPMLQTAVYLKGIWNWIDNMAIVYTPYFYLSHLMTYWTNTWGRLGTMIFGLGRVDGRSRWCVATMVLRKCGRVTPHRDKCRCTKRRNECKWLIRNFQECVVSPEIMYNIHRGGALVNPIPQCPSLIIAIDRINFSGLISDMRAGWAIGVEWNSVPQIASTL
jgi:hypothetical protein